MTIIAPSRMKGFALTMAALALAIALLGILAKIGASRVSQAMADGDSTMEGGQENIVGGRIAGVLAEIHNGTIRPDTELGVILGASAVGMDIEPSTLEAAAGPKIPSRWLSLSANGANMSDIRGLTELVTGSKLHVKLLVLGVHPTLLAHSDHYLSDPTEADARPFWTELEAGNLNAAKDLFAGLMLTPLNRLFRERTRIGHQSRVLTANAKRRLFAAMGLGADSLFAPVHDPWSVRLLIPDDESPVRAGRVSAREIQEGALHDHHLGEVKDKGWYDPVSYAANDANARDLVATIREVRSSGIEVVLLLLPERSDLRSRVPREATLCLRETILDNFNGDAPVVIDVRDAIPDDLFHDSVHLRNEARSLTTLRLIEALRIRPRDPAAR